MQYLGRIGGSIHLWQNGYGLLQRQVDAIRVVSFPADFSPSVGGEGRKVGWARDYDTRTCTRAQTFTPPRGRGRLGANLGMRRVWRSGGETKVKNSEAVRSGSLASRPTSFRSTDRFPYRHACRYGKRSVLRKKVS